MDVDTTAEVLSHLAAAVRHRRTTLIGVRS